MINSRIIFYASFVRYLKVKIKNPETVFRQLGDLYEFYREIKKFKIEGKSPADAMGNNNKILSNKCAKLAESHTEYNTSQK
jgi:hypothetical protein